MHLFLLLKILTSKNMASPFKAACILKKEALKSIFGEISESNQRNNKLVFFVKNAFSFFWMWGGPNNAGVTFVFQYGRFQKQLCDLGGYKMNCKVCDLKPPQK